MKYEKRVQYNFFLFVNDHGIGNRT